VEVVEVRMKETHQVVVLEEEHTLETELVLELLIKDMMDNPLLIQQVVVVELEKLEVQMDKDTEEMV
tara:strand:- start:294 stop:494 length:201 start_codon:yes stop_codon:yes gene_type:complete